MFISAVFIGFAVRNKKLRFAAACVGATIGAAAGQFVFRWQLWIYMGRFWQVRFMPRPDSYSFFNFVIRQFFHGLDDNTIPLFVAGMAVVSFLIGLLPAESFENEDPNYDPWTQKLRDGK